MKNSFTPPAGIDALCKNVAETTFDMLSEENVSLFKDRVLDISGCMFGGSIVKEDGFFTQRLRDWGGKPEAPVFTKDFRLPLPGAAMLNCMYARANDFGCMSFHIMGEMLPAHNSETVIPLGLTLADTFAVSGRQFIANDVAAEDITARLLYMLPVRWPTDMLLGSTAAAALAARYYDLDGDGVKTALSYAATNATDPANAYYDYSQEFKYHNSESARMGIMAAEMAKGGWRGFADPYFGHWGLIAKQTKDGGLPELYEKGLEDLGVKYYTEGSFKRQPGGIPTTAMGICGRVIRQKLIDADGSFDAEKIRQVRVYRSSVTSYNYYSKPFVLRNHTNALFSYQFGACCALYYGKVGVEDVQTDAILANPALYEMVENSTMETYDALGKPMMKVVVELKDGRVFSHEEDYASAMGTHPGRQFLEEKFRAQLAAAGTVDTARADKLIELNKRLETLSDMREYTSLLQP